MSEIAAPLAFADEPQFKVRACENAAQVVETVSDLGLVGNMVANRFERIFITVLTAVCCLMAGYAVPLHLKLDWRWRLLALPATVLVGWFTWARYSGGHQTEVALENVSSLERGVVTVGMAGVGFAAPFLLSLELNGALPHWTTAVPLGFVLAVCAGLIAWRHPSLFFVNRGF